MSKPVVICVDDDPIVLESLRLELIGAIGDLCYIRAAEGGEEALALINNLQAEGHEIAIVLSDYLMPKLQGNELLTAVHRLSPQTLTILISAQATLKVVGDALRTAQLYCFIAKPWQPDDLNATVTAALQTYLRDRRLKSRATQLQARNVAQTQLLASLQEAKNALREKADREAALNRVLKAIRGTLDLNTIFAAAVTEIRQLLQVDRVAILRYSANHRQWIAVADSAKDWLAGSPIADLTLSDANNPILSSLHRLAILRLDNTQHQQSAIDPAVAQALAGAWLWLPLDFDAQIWGCLSLIHHQPYVWQSAQIELVSAVADQLAIAIQQSELYQQVQQLNDTLEKQVQERTQQLQQALEFEALLKRITDRVRDSLDEQQILQTAVNELAKVLNVDSCDTALYNLEQRTSTIVYEYTQHGFPSDLGGVYQMEILPEFYGRLLQGQPMQFCWLFLPSNRGELSPRKLEDTHFSVLALPIIDDQGVMGDLWLYRLAAIDFSQAEVRLVQQVANQCAIALRQSRLYQTTLAQVTELERLNHLKDDFLSSVSHELRSPMSNIKMATQMLEILLHQSNSFATHPHIDRYFQILQEECQRETQLINDLLDLARLEAHSDPLQPILVDLTYWLDYLAEPFLERTRNQRQQLTIDVPAELPPLYTDVAGLERIVIELLHNACKYTAIGEQIVVTAIEHQSAVIPPNWGADSKPPPPCPPSALQKPTPSWIQISVRNSGIEIPVDERDRIFEKFYRIPSSDPWKYGGTGLGLALVKRQAERLQGAIALEHRPGWVGFVLTLPRELRQE
jgi:signal transduction histidine kinase/response regulator of citrate/malate metabolism